MNNLKKVLALGLALVMLLGMFTVASAADGVKVATDLTDWNSIKHQNAVALCVDLGIIEGMPDGSFAPADNINRSAWAKLAYIAANGDADADAYLGTTTTLSDIQGNWAESYISFLFANKYISGDQFGHYNPDNNVTVVEACKTMLTILGFNAVDRGYVNDAAWSGKIMTDAKAAGLMKNVDQSALQPLTRDNAAQVIYNALQARYREENKTYDMGNQYVASYSQKATLGYKVFGIVKLTGVVTGVNTDGTLSSVTAWNVDNNDNAIISSTGKITNGVVKASVADVGQLCDVFVEADAQYNEEDGWFTTVNVTDVVSTAVTRSDVEPLKVLTDETTFASNPDNVWKRTSDEYVGVEADVVDGTADDYDLHFYVDGEPKPAQDLKKGEVAKLYDTTGSGKVDTITILQYKVGELTGKVATRTDGNIEKAIIPGVTNSYVPTSQISGNWSSLEKGDVVLYYTNGKTGDDMVVGIEPAESVTGVVSSVSGDGHVTINGKSYDCTGINANHVESKMKVWGDFDNEYTFYLDKNGGVCYDVQNTDEAVTNNVAVVLESKWISNGSIDASEYLEAKLMFTDGTTEVVRVNKIGVGTPYPTMKTIVADDRVTSTNANRVISISDVADTLMESTDANGDACFSYADGFFSYRVDANGYYEIAKLMQRTNDYARQSEVSKSYVDGIVKRPSFDGTNSANSNTVFMVMKDNGDTQTFGSYTGYANVPAVSRSNIAGGVAIYERNDTTGGPMGSAKFVFIKASALADDIPDGFVFVRSTNANRDVDGNYTAKVLSAKGEETTMVFSEDAWNVISDTTAIPYNSDRLFAIDEVNEGVVNSVEQVAEDMYANGTVHKGALVEYGDGVVTINDTAEGDKGFTVDDKTVVVLIDMGADKENHAKDKPGYAGVQILGVNDTVDMDPNVYDATYSYVALIADAQNDLCDYVYIIRTVNLEA